MNPTVTLMCQNNKMEIVFITFLNTFESTLYYWWQNEGSFYLLSRSHLLIYNIQQDNITERN